MFRGEIIGNLGADAEVRQGNDGKYCIFRVADTAKFTNPETGEITERTTWVSVSLNRDPGKLADYLKRGTKVFCRGNLVPRLYIGHDGQKHAGLNLFATEVELCGANSITTDGVLSYIDATPAARERIFNHACKYCDLEALKAFVAQAEQQQATAPHQP